MVKQIDKRVTEKVTQDVTANRFASYSGGHPSADGIARGVYEFDQTNGELATIAVGGMIEIELAGNVTGGDNIKSDANGKGLLATAGSYVNGIALADGTAGGKVLIELKSFKI